MPWRAGLILYIDGIEAVECNGISTELYGRIYSNTTAGLEGLVDPSGYCC